MKIMKPMASPILFTSSGLVRAVVAGWLASAADHGPARSAQLALGLPQGRLGVLLLMITDLALEGVHADDDAAHDSGRSQGGEASTSSSRMHGQTSV
jgi:hypothetical protein